MTALTFEATKRGYAHLWDRAHVVNVAGATAAALKIAAPAARTAFEHVQSLTNVPWFMVAVILFRESNLNFGTYLGNGEVLAHVTTLVPAGRGPFTGPNAFYNGCVDALTHEGMDGFDPKSWTIERILYWLERFNGLGYFAHNVNDPYLWSWTDQYTRGKFTADGHFDASVVDPQGGCAAVIKILEAQGIITLAREAIPVSPAPQPKEPSPVTTAPVPITAAAIKAGTPGSFTQIVAEIETGVALAQKYVGMVAPFIPAQFQPFLAILPILDDILLAIEDVQKAQASGGSVLAVVAQHLQAIGGKVQAMAPAVAASAVPAGATIAGVVVQPPPQTPG